MSLKLGLVINPIAGVGASLAWKGTDDIDRAWDAVAEGKPQPVWAIVQRALQSLPNYMEIDWVLGADYKLGLEGMVVGWLPERSRSETTREAVKLIAEQQPDLIIFVGGDGTAADVADSVKLPILGIPAGVKIYSPVFLHRPEDLGDFLDNWEMETTKVDILDLDEESYRQGQPVAKLITSATIPASSTIQAGKVSWTAPDSETFELIAERIIDDDLLQGTILIGPGSTMSNIFAALGMELSLLGVDVVVDGELVLLDGTADQLEQFQPDEIWITPIGNQGHIFGRGNRQITPKLIDQAKIRVFATLEKARETQTLFVDTGDVALDKRLRGFLPVIVGYHEEILKRVS